MILPRVCFPGRKLLHERRGDRQFATETNARDDAGTGNGSDVPAQGAKAETGKEEHECDHENGTAATKICMNSRSRFKIFKPARHRDNSLARKKELGGRLERAMASDSERAALDARS